MNNIHCIPVGNGEPLHQAHTLCWCYPVLDDETINLYSHNARDCREKYERMGAPVPVVEGDNGVSLWVTVEERL